MENLQLPSDEDFIEVPGMRGLRLARLGQADGRTLELVEAVKDMVIPAMTHPGSEKGRVLSGALRFMKAGEVSVYREGDEWTVAANETQGPHVVIESGTRILLLRDGPHAFDS